MNGSKNKKRNFQKQHSAKPVTLAQSSASTMTKQNHSDESFAEALAETLSS